MRLLTIFAFYLTAMTGWGQTTYTVSNLGDAGDGSLRQAILDAEASDGADIIDLTGVTGTITLTSALPNITEGLTINGSTTGTLAIDGDSQFRIFFIVNATAPTVSINNLTLQNGYAKGGDGGTGGGGLGAGGAIYGDNVNLTLATVAINSSDAIGGSPTDGASTIGGSGPFAGSSGTFGVGGNSGSQTNYFSRNGGAGGYGAGGGSGGFGYSTSIQTFFGGTGGSGGTFGGSGITKASSGSSFMQGGGGAGLGGALFIRAGSLTLNNVSFTNNSATRGTGYQNGQGKGGALFLMDGVEASGEGVSFSGNTASDAGSTETDDNDIYGTIEVLTNIVIETDPADQTVQQGDNATVSVVASGSGATYQWQAFDGNLWIDLTDGNGVSGALTSELTVSCVDTDLNQAQYRCVVEGTLNTETSAAATITVTDYPAMTVTLAGPDEVHCDAGNTFTYTASAANTVDEPLFTWYKNDEVVPDQSAQDASISVVAGDVVKVELTDPGACFEREGVSSNAITLGQNDGSLLFEVTNNSDDQTMENSLPWAVAQVNALQCEVPDVTISIATLDITISSTLSLENSVSIQGVSSGNSQITYTGTSGGLFEANSPLDYLEFSGLGLYQSGGSSTGDAIYINQVDSLFIDGLYAEQGFGDHDILEAAALYVEISDLTASGNDYNVFLKTNGLGATEADPIRVILENSDLRNANRAALYIDESEPVHLTVKGTHFQGFGESIKLSNALSTYEFVNSSFAHSYASAIAIANQAVASFTSCTFSSNGLQGKTDNPGFNYGAIIQDAMASLTVTNCTFYNNQAGILYGNNTGAFDINIYNSIFLDNADGVMINYSGDNEPTVDESSNLGYPDTYTGAATDVINTSLKYMGQAQAHELIPCSPANDLADDTFAPEKDAADKERLSAPDQGAVEGYGFINYRLNDRTVYAGSATSIAIATSGESLTYQWQVDEGSGFVDLAEAGTYTGTTTGTLSIGEVVDEMETSTYRVKISDGSCEVSSNAIMIDVQHVPVSADASITVNEDAVYTFSASDIPFTDEDGDLLQSVVLATDVTNGSLYNDGVAIVFDNDSDGDSRRIAQSKEGGSTFLTDLSRLTYEPPADQNGDAYDAFTFSIRDDSEYQGRLYDGHPTYTMTINVAPVNDAPTDLELSANAIDENNAEQAVVATLTTTDIDEGDAHTYTLVAGEGDDDNASFSISNDQLLTASSFNFEEQDSYAIRLATSDGTQSFEKSLIITVNDVNDAPVIQLSANTVDENVEKGTEIGDLSSSDEDAGATDATITLVNGVTDNAEFEISGGKLVTAATLDFETKSSYQVTVKADDGEGGVTEEVYDISVKDVNEAPTDITVATTSVDENVDLGTVIGSISTVDEDADDTHTYTVVTTLELDGLSYKPVKVVSGQVVTAIPVDHETLSALGIEFTSEDAAGLKVTKTINFTVNDLNEAPTAIALSSNTIAENEPSGTSIGSLSTTDEDAGDSHTYSLSAAVEDNDAFELEGNQLKSAASFDFETQKLYTVKMTTTDAEGLTYDELLTIDVTDVDEVQAQTITFEALADKTFGDSSFELGATASSGLAVSYSSSDAAIASIDGSTVTIHAAGEVTITASQEGNANYEAATAVTQTLTIHKAAQSITFEALADKTFGDSSFDLSATASSGLVVSYRSSDAAIASIDGSTVTIHAAGEVTITADQEGNANYEAATAVTQTLTIHKAAQSITFEALADKTFGDASFDLSATASSGLAASYRSSDAAIASIDGSTVTVHAAGEVTITADQEGNANYEAATAVTQTLTIHKAAQSISFDPIEDVREGTLVTLTASASSGLEITFEVTGPVTLSGNELTSTGSGTVNVTATQAGNKNYLAAEPVVQSFAILESESFVLQTVKETLNIYPNPVADHLTIDLQNTYRGEVLLKLVNMSGSTVKQQVYQKQKDRFSVEENLDTIPGTYLLIISMGKEQSIHRIVKD